MNRLEIVTKGQTDHDGHPSVDRNIQYHRIKLAVNVALLAGSVAGIIGVSHVPDTSVQASVTPFLTGVAVAAVNNIVAESSGLLQVRNGNRAFQVSYLTFETFNIIPIPLLFLNPAYPDEVGKWNSTAGYEIAGLLNSFPEVIRLGKQAIFQN